MFSSILTSFQSSPKISPETGCPPSLNTRKPKGVQSVRMQPARIYAAPVIQNVGTSAGTLLLPASPLFTIHELSSSSLLKSDVGGVAASDTSDTSDATTDQSMTPFSSSPVLDNLESRGSWLRTEAVRRPGGELNSIILMRPGLDAMDGFFANASLDELTDWRLLSEKMERLCTLPHAIGAELNPQLIKKSEINLYQYFMRQYGDTVENRMREGFLASSKSLYDYFSEVLGSVLETMTIDNPFQQVYLHAPLCLIKCIDGIDAVVQKAAFYSVLDVVRMGVLSRIISPELKRRLSPDVRHEWMTSLLRVEHRDALLDAVYVSVNGDENRDIPARVSYITGSGACFLEKLFGLPKESLNLFSDFYYDVHGQPHLGLNRV